MQPDKSKITISGNRDKIIELLQDLIIAPRAKAVKWSNQTHQTPNIKIWYPGQHLASLILWMYGEKTWARGNDIIDGTEVKSCSRIDQLDKCSECKGPVARIEPTCQNCWSTKIERKNDSKWLFTVRDENDLRLLVDGVPRILLLLWHYPYYDKHDYETIWFEAYEIWPRHPRFSRFGEIMTNYYSSIYLEHKKKDSNKVPAPKNFWPYSYQFYLCQPIKIFECQVHNASSEPDIKIHKYIEPSCDRGSIESERLPSQLLEDSEIDIVLNAIYSQKVSAKEIDLSLGTKPLPEQSTFSLPLKKKKFRETFKDFGTEIIQLLPLRDTDKISQAWKKYTRKSYSKESVPSPAAIPAIR